MIINRKYVSYLTRLILLLIILYTCLLVILGLYVVKYLKIEYAKNNIEVSTKKLMDLGLYSTTNSSIDNVGIAPYAIRNKTFPCKALFKGLRGVKNLHVSWLHDSFGTRDVCLRRVMADKRLRTVHIHLLNQVCVRNRNCSPYEILAGYNVWSLEEALLAKDPILYDKIGKFAFKLQEFLNETLQPGTRCIIDPMLESDVNDEAANKLITFLKRNYFPNCEFSWISNGSIPKKSSIREWHGSGSTLEPMCIRNLDGEDVSFPGLGCRLPSKYTCIKSSELPAFIQNNKQCEATFLWSAEMNCVHSIVRMPPRSRICEDNGVYKAFGDLIRQFQ